MVSASPRAVTVDARNHFHSLRGAGWSLRSIAAHAHVGTQDLYRFLDGADVPHVEHGLLSIDIDTIATRTNVAGAEPFVPRVGTVRRLQALMCIGWPAREINTRLHALGVTDKRAAENLLGAPGRWVTRSRHDAVAAVYRDLSPVPGPSSRSRTRAQKAGYASPAQWDDIDHDQAPDQDDIAQPTDTELDEVAVLRRMEGDRTVPLSNQERQEVVRRMHARRLQDGTIETLTGIHRDQVGQDRRELGLPANPNPEHTGLSEQFSARGRARRSGQVAS